MFTILFSDAYLDIYLNRKIDEISITIDDENISFIYTPIRTFFANLIEGHMLPFAIISHKEENHIDNLIAVISSFFAIKIFSLKLDFNKDNNCFDIQHPKQLDDYLKIKRSQKSFEPFTFTQGCFGLFKGYQDNIPQERGKKHACLFGKIHNPYVSITFLRDKKIDNQALTLVQKFNKITHLIDSDPVTSYFMLILILQEINKLKNPQDKQKASKQIYENLKLAIPGIEAHFKEHSIFWLLIEIRNAYIHNFFIPQAHSIRPQNPNLLINYANFAPEEISYLQETLKIKEDSELGKFFIHTNQKKNFLIPSLESLYYTRVSHLAHAA